ncbi:MAG: transposase [Herminiimonas sp.]|nr:transposase [Herminiimonas sp.]
MDDAVCVPTVFTKNRERLIAHDAVVELFNHIVETADRMGRLSGEHFSVDGGPYPGVGQSSQLRTQGWRQ